MDVLHYLSIDDDWTDGSVMQEYISILESDDALADLCEAHKALYGFYRTHPNGIEANPNPFREAADVLDDAIDERKDKALWLAARRHSKNRGE